MLKVAFVGGASVGLQFLKILLEQPVEIIGVVPSHLGEKNKPTIAPFAEERQLALVNLQDIGPADAILSVGNHALFPETLCKKRIVNFHAAPLPKYAGSAAHAWATLNEVTEFGVTFHYICRELDAGPVLYAERFAVDPKWTAAELENRCVKSGVAAFERLGLEMLEGKITATPGIKPKKLYKRRDLDQYREINMYWPRDKIWRHIRAFDWDGILQPAFFRLRGHKIFLTAKTRGLWL